MSLQAFQDDVVSPHSTRTTGDRITSERLAEIWPAASRRLLRVLELRGVDPSSAEDLVQEVVVRAIQSGVTFEGLDDFLWWATPVARNLHIDLIRSSKWSVAASELPEREAPAARVDHVVERRLALESVLQHLSTMPEADREAIVAAAVDAPVDVSRRGSVAVRRHRARAHLRRVVGTALGLSGAGAFLRRLRASGVATAPMTAVALAMPALAYAVGSVPAPSYAVPAGRAHTVAVDVSGAEARVLSHAGGVMHAASGGRTARAGDGPQAAPPAESAVAAAAIVRPTDPKEVEVKPVDERGARIETRPSDGKDSLVCLYGGKMIRSRCVEYPIEGQDTVNANVSVR